MNYQCDKNVFSYHLMCLNENNLIFRGTNVASGLAIARITAIGNKTKLGAIGKS